MTNDGHVALAVLGMHETGTTAARRSFKVAVGPLYPVAQLTVLGTITTDMDGNFVGTPERSDGTFRLSQGTTITRAVVAGDGAVALCLQNVRELATGTPVVDRALEVWIAQFFTPFGFAGPLAGRIGQIQTDTRGNYSGPIVRFDGSNFSFGGAIAPGEGPPFSIQFIINTPGVRSELVTGIRISG